MKYILASILLPIFVYFLGAFMAASFDITTWTVEGRFLNAVFMGCIGLTPFSIGYLQGWK